MGLSLFWILEIFSGKTSHCLTLVLMFVCPLNVKHFEGTSWTLLLALVVLCYHFFLIIPVKSEPEF